MLRKHPFIFMFSFVLVLFIGFACFAYYIVEGGIITNALSSMKKQIEPTEAVYNKRPKDSDVKKTFLAHRKDFVKLKDMFVEDKLSYLDKGCIIHEDDYKHATFVPYSLGEIPKNALLDKKIVELFMTLMNQCGATRITVCDAGRDNKSDSRRNDDDDENTATSKNSKSAQYTSDGVKFHMFDETDKDSREIYNKYIVYWKSDDFNSVPDTDAVKKDKNGEVNEQSRIEPNWYVWKYQTVSKSRK